MQIHYQQHFYFFTLFSALISTPISAHAEANKTGTLNQTLQSGATAVTHAGSGNINITGYSIEDHRKILKQEKQNLRNELNALHSLKTENLTLKKQLLENQISKIEAKLSTQNNLQNSYKQRIAFLENTIKSLRELQADNKDKRFAQAEAALQLGYTRKADQLLAEIEKAAEHSIKRAAKAAFERGEIANEKIDYKKAYKHYLRAAQLRPENPLYLAVAGSLAGTLAKYNKEIELNELALALYIKEEGENSANVVILRNNLGLAWDSKGQYDKAIDYYEKTLNSSLKTFGEDHPIVAMLWNNLGSAWNSKGQYEKAIGYYEKALSSELKTFGEDYPNVARLWNNLGEAWHSKRQYDKAIDYYEKALSSDLKIFGEDHPNVAMRWNNLGSAWHSKGQYEKAISYYEKALNSDLKAFGEDHPNVARLWNNLGGAWHSKGQYEKAIDYYEKALSSDLKTFGEDHPDVAIDWNNLGEAWRLKGQYDKAIGYYEKALNVLINRLGENHPTTKTVKDTLDLAKQASLKP